MLTSNTRLRIQCHKNGVTGVGNPNSRIVFVGSYPAPNEVTAFTGRPGRILNTLLESIGLTRADVFLTNVMCYYVEKPSQQQINECTIRLEAELALIKPKIVVAFGDIAAQYLAHMQLKKCRGSVIWINPSDLRAVNDKGYYLLCTYQPASALYGNGITIHDLVRDFEKIPEILTWEEDGSHNKIDYEVINTQEQAQNILNSLLHRGVVAVDIETATKDLDSKDVFVDKLMCLCVATEDKAWVFPATICKGLVWPVGPEWAFHSGIFDAQGLRRYLGVELPIIHDTLLMSYCLDERKGRHSLKPLSRGYCGAEFYEENVPVGKANLTPQQWESLYKYNAHDGVYTARLVPILHKKCVEDNVIDVYDKLLLPAANMFTEVQLRGTYIDKERHRQLGLEYFPKWLQEEKELREFARAEGYPGDINLNSWMQLSDFLFKILKLPGGPSTRKEVLESIADMHPFVNRLLEFRKLDKVISNWIVGIQDDIKFDSRVHAYVNLNGTTTGRLSYNNPPMQTIPKPRSDEDVEFEKLREMFSATNDDYVIVETDYEKAEVWVAQALSQDPNLYDDLLSSDFHRKVASVVYHTPYAEVSERQRFNAKRTTFGIIYGITEAALSKLLKCTRGEAHDIIWNWYGRYSKYFEWFEETKQTLFRDGEIVSPLGRKRRFKIFVGEYWKSINQAVNFPVQSIASDCTLSSGIELHPKLKLLDSYILWLCHDAIYFEVAKKYLEEALHTIKEVMETPRFSCVPGIPVEIKVGSRLSNTKKIKL